MSTETNGSLLTVLATRPVELLKEQTEALQETTEKMGENARKLAMAGLGAVVVAQEEGFKLLQEMSKKGARVDLPEVPGREQAEALVGQMQKQVTALTTALQERVDEVRFIATEATAKVERNVHDAVTAVLNRMGVPTRAEIQELTLSVERLAANLDKIGGAAPAPVVTGTEEIVAVPVGGGWYEITVGGVVVNKVQGKANVAEALATLKAA